MRSTPKHPQFPQNCVTPKHVEVRLSQDWGTKPADGLLPVKAARLLHLMRACALVFMLACGLVFIAGVLLYPAYSTAHPEQFVVWNWTEAEMEQILSRVGFSFNWWLQYNLVNVVHETIQPESLSLWLIKEEAMGMKST